MSSKELAILLNTVSENYPTTDLTVVEKAYEFAKEAHEGQLRKSGDPYIVHAYATGLQLAKWKMPPVMVAAGLLHDVPEDTKHTIADLEKNFGPDIASIVEGETKISKLQYQGVQRYAENLRKMFLSMAKDVRVVVVKFADRYHNLVTLDALPRHRQKRMAVESLEIYAPIANRLGMGLIRGELEDLAFKYVLPKEFEWVVSIVKDRVHQKEEYLEKVKTIVEKKLKEAGIETESVHGRVKHLYSLYRKLLEKDRDINKVYDLVAERIIVPTVQDCYATLGILHQIWAPLKGRIKDYIAQPKPNGYQSLHTTVFCEDGEIVEFQIRTPEMHEEAEFGIAAHWFYTEGGKKSKRLDQHLKWLKELAEIQKNLQDRTKFLEAVESLKLDLFKSRIFVFTPHGDVIDLPEKATPVDFAYAIHTEIGNHCTGARINEEMSPLSTILQSGDVVEIVTDKKRKCPSADWLKFVKTSHARDKIKEALKKHKLRSWMSGLVHRKS